MSAMPFERVLTWTGALVFSAAAGMLLIGSEGPPILPAIAAVLGASLVALGLVLSRRATAEQTAAEPVGTAASKIAAVALAAVGAMALVVALLVAVGDARGHAAFHFVPGAIGLVAFTGLALLWRPVKGSLTAGLRILILVQVGLGTLGQFLESIGGSGYDAANDGRRIELLTGIHDIAVWFGFFALFIPLGLVVLVVVLVSRFRRRVAA